MLHSGLCSARYNVRQIELTGGLESDEIVGDVRNEGGHVEGRVLRRAHLVLLHHLHQPDHGVKLGVVQNRTLVNHHLVSML